MRLQPNTSLKELLQAVPLPAQAINDVSARLDQGCLEHVRKKGEDGIEGLELLIFADFAVLDTGEEFGENGKVEYEGGGEEGVLERGIRN